MQVTDWLFVEVALLLKNLKSGFDHPSVIESLLRLATIVVATIH
jgi:hypothetical protein